MKKILLFFIGVTSFCFSYSQVTNFTDFNITALTTNENFKDVNTDYFLPITATGIDDEDRYVVTVTRIADELRRLYGNNSNRTAVNNVFGGFSC